MKTEIQKSGRSTARTGRTAPNHQQKTEIYMASNAHSNCAHALPRAERIAGLNDQLRVRGLGGRIVMTRGVHALTGADVSDLLKALATFQDFDSDSDPHGERDFGLVDYAGHEILWRIEYFADAELRFGSNDPADPFVTERVLTIMLAEEY
jgi:hypothetical protein